MLLTGKLTSGAQDPSGPVLVANGIMLMTAAQCPSRPLRATLNPFIPPWSHHCLLNQCEQQGPKTPPSLPPFGQAEVMPAVRDRQRDGDRHAEDR